MFSAAQAFCFVTTIRLRLDGDLQHTIAMLGKEPVGIGNLIEFEAVGEQWRQIQTSVKHHLHQASHALLSTWTERRDDFVIAQTCSKRLKRYGQLPRVPPPPPPTPASSREEADQGHSIAACTETDTTC